jgi:hypothetical protein
MNTKLFLQILLALGCLGLVMALAESATRYYVLLIGPQSWWRGAMACWMLIVAVRMVYPAQAK